MRVFVRKYYTGVIIALCIIIIYYTKGYFWQLPFFDCKTPTLKPYNECYDCLKNDVYFIHSEISDLALLFGLYWLGKNTRANAAISTTLALSFGGFMDMVFNLPNNNLTVFFVGAALLHLAYLYGRKERG